MKTRFVYILLVVALCRCNEKDGPQQKNDPLFTLLPSSQTGIDFSNTLTEGLNTNVLLYEYFYNGGGVAAGDLNDDGLDDLYFSANMSDNKLYLNKGNLKFEDITLSSRAGGRPGPWKTGVSMADVNGDGRLDIYLCYSGKMAGIKRANQLFINQGNDAAGVPVFSEQAASWGLADTAYSTQSYFFDFDHDGDLDMFLLNHNPMSFPILDEAATAAMLKKPNPSVGVRLYRNDNNRFQDITPQTGISSTSLTYGLGAGIADLNGDGWQDIYVSNDYSIPDYLYINNHDGTFTDSLPYRMGHITHFSMGNAVVDVNNDTWPDVYTLDMLPADNRRQKLLMAPDNYEKFDLSVKTGFHPQFMRNMLQMNNGNGSFSETGQISGISNTDWSWAPLFADYDNDGWKDLFVTNGYTRDYTNMDFLKYMNGYVQGKGRLKREDVLEIVRQMPSSNVINYLFRNDSGFLFTDVSREWGMDSASNSNGAVYSDLDNDGDLDLVVNNINAPAFIFQNQASKNRSFHYLNIKLKGDGKNTKGTGAKLYAYTGDNKQVLEQVPSPGYQSSVSPILHFGFGKNNSIDSIRIAWPGGKQQVLRDVRTDQLITLQESEASMLSPSPKKINFLYREALSPLLYRHAGNDINDFKRQPLMVNPLSFAGPCLVKGDVNNDGMEDIYAGAGSGYPATLYIGQTNGKFRASPQAAFAQDGQSEDADAVFFDADGNGSKDLYVASGGFHNYTPDDPLLQDRLYLNDGKGNFSKAEGRLPQMLVSKGCVRAADINNDGYTDLFVGGRAIPGRYPEKPQSFLLTNDGQGKFTDRMAALAPSLQRAGMITDAAFADMNGDDMNDLVLAGEWMPLTVMVQSGGRFTDRTTDYFDKTYSGWWNKLLLEDLNGDGIKDLVAGNYGLNSQCRASDREPAELYYKDFDDNGSVDPILCYYIQHQSYPFLTRDELLDQMSIYRTRYTDYKSYADTRLEDIFSTEQLKDAGHLKVNLLETAYFERGKGGKFILKNLPVETQLSPVYTVNAIDYDKDGARDLLLCGNINRARLRFGKSDANYGMLLHNDGKGNFTYIPQHQSGFMLKGDVRSVVDINGILLFGINQQPVAAYQKN